MSTPPLLLELPWFRQSGSKKVGYSFYPSSLKHFYFHTFRVPKSATYFLLFAFLAVSSVLPVVLFVSKKQNNTNTDTGPKVQRAILLNSTNYTESNWSAIFPGYTQSLLSLIRVCVLTSTLRERWERTFHATFEGLRKKWSMRKESSQQWLHPRWRVRQKRKK